MALWRCLDCEARYSVGASGCPHCGGQEHFEEGQQEMPKTTVHGGASISLAPGQEPPAELPEDVTVYRENDEQAQSEEGGEESSPGSSSETSSEKQPTKSGTSGRGRRSRARTTENP